MTTLLFLASLINAVLAGVVTDVSGAAVSGASVVLRTASGAEQQTLTGPDGRFTLVLPDGEQATLIVRSAGFAEERRAIANADAVEVVLSPAAVLETITVTPTRGEQRAADIPASIAVLDAQAIRQSPAIVADDVFRQIPTFSLFRRTSSLASHPTTQGVSLRGIGPSGVSRTLVLLDDVPLNDPFGGWVHWTRVPLENVERVEVVEGPSSSLYGNYGMGGVISIVSAKATRRTFELSPQYGARDTRKVEAFGSNVWRSFGLAVNGSVFDTDGFPIVSGSERGLVDNKAAVSFRNVSLKADYTFNRRVSAFFRAGRFREERNNGKASTINGDQEANDTTWTSTASGVRMVLPDESSLQARIFTDHERFDSNFLAVPVATPARSIGRMTLKQHVPTESVGGMVQWSRPLGPRHDISAGADWRRVDGDSEEDALDAVRGETVTLHRVSGGTQQSAGAFVQDVIRPFDRLTVTASARVDRWRNYDAHNLETIVPAGTPAAGNRPALPEREDTVGSPRVAALYHLTDRVSVWGGMSWGFRAPSLNELYRQFRVGAILTLANENLGPERLKGGEAGVNLSLTRFLTVRSVWFDNRVRNPVSNVTVALNTQQRQNLGRTRIRGVQTDGELRLTDRWRVTGGYLFNRARVVEFAANPALVSNCNGVAGEACFLPQVPQHRGSFRVGYTNLRVATISVGAQFVGRQFDDDQNIRVVPGESAPGLPGFAVWDLTLSRALGKRLSAFAGVQNLTGTEYVVGTLPTTIGSPRLATVGLRLRLSGVTAR